MYRIYIFEHFFAFNKNAVVLLWSTGLFVNKTVY